MKKHLRFLRHSFRSIFILIILSLILGCAYGKIRPGTVETGRIHEFIDQQYAISDISYSGDRSIPGAIRFDIKDDDIALTGAGWHPVESKEQLHGMVDGMILKYNYWGTDAQGPRISVILDRNDKKIGYLFSPMDYTTIRSDGENYSLEPVTELDIRERARPGLRGAGA
jgi:hypothetical protein